MRQGQGVSQAGPAGGLGGNARPWGAGPWWSLGRDTCAGEPTGGAEGFCRAVSTLGNSWKPSFESSS